MKHPFGLYCRLKAQAAARGAAKKKAETEALSKEQEALRMAAIVDLMSVSDQQAGANGVVKGSNPSQDCQSFPAALKDPSNIKDGEEFNFLKKDFDVPQRVAAQVDCLGVRVDELKSQFDDNDIASSRLDDDDAHHIAERDTLPVANEEEDHKDRMARDDASLRAAVAAQATKDEGHAAGRGAAQTQTQPQSQTGSSRSGSRRRSSKSEEHMAQMKEKLDTLLDKEVNVESGSFFDLFELGDVVSSVFKYL